MTTNVDVLVQSQPRKPWFLMGTAMLLSTGCYTWRAVDDKVFDDGEIYAVAHNDQILVAVGVVYTALGMNHQEDAAVWYSTDRRTWQRLQDNAVFGGAGHQEMRDVVWTGSAFVAGGEDWSGGDGDAAFWRSIDGVTWTRVPHVEAVFGGPGYQLVTELEAGSSGVVAVGGTRPPPGAADIGDPAAWVSVDGQVWQRVVVVELTDVSGAGAESQGQLATDLVVGRSGTSVVSEVVGRDGSQPGWCGHWGITQPGPSSYAMIRGLTDLDICPPTTAWHLYPDRVAYYDGYTYAVTSFQATDAFPQTTVYSVLVSPPGGGWTTLINFSDERFSNFTGDGRFDGVYALVGNRGDFGGMTAWVWWVGVNERASLDRVVTSDEAIFSMAYDVTEFQGVPVAVGSDFIGPLSAPGRVRGIVWYREYCSILQLPFCNPD